MSPPPAVFRALIEAIPVEEDAAFIAQAGERGRITSRAGSVNMGSMPLTVAAIDKLNATIFPPDQLQALQQTGLAQFDFVLPGIDGTFTALAGSGPDDRWLDIRRRSTAPAARVRPAAEAAAAPKTTTGFYDRADLASLEFPSRGGDSDLGPLTVPNDIFERPAGAAQSDLGPLTVPDDIFEGPVGDAFNDSWDEGQRQTETLEVVAADSGPARTILGLRRPARWFGVALAVTVCLVVAWQVVSRFGATRPPSAGQTAASRSLPGAPPPPPSPAARASVPPPGSPAPLPQPSTAAIPQATSPAQTAPSSAPVTPAIRVDEASRSGFSVQVAAVRTRDEADRIVTRFVSQGYPAYLVRGEGAAANYYRVRIGAFPDRKSAEDVAKELEGTEGIKPWITKETPENKTAASQLSLRQEPPTRR